jgi:hypothetical protein
MTLRLYSGIVLCARSLVVVLTATITILFRRSIDRLIGITINLVANNVDAYQPDPA